MLYFYIGLHPVITGASFPCTIDGPESSCRAFARHRIRRSVRRFHEVGYTFVHFFWFYLIRQHVHVLTVLIYGVLARHFVYLLVRLWI